MNQQGNHFYSGHEAALAYALCAERLFGNDGSFLDANPSVIPIFVSQLMQSLEISIKYAAIKSGLFTIKEARDRQRGSGHSIKELAALAVERLGGDPFDPIVMAMTFSNSKEVRSSYFIKEMICGDKLEGTRRCYSSRGLGYAEVSDGDCQIISPTSEWIESVKQTAANLPSTIEILSGWKASASESKHFAIWLKGR